ncbi:MAG: DUF616 domain-containing protein [Candidatus Eremiobacteraeota bacterium]|nr:DUF616 domain-containing protein [Candidatus Eremiobacteraeota bacterium]
MSVPVVYTAVSGRYDELAEVPEELVSAGVRLVAFLDQGVHSAFEIRELDSVLPESVRGLDSNRRAKWCKLHPHELFPDHEVSLWVDGNIGLQSSLPELFSVTGAWCCFPHPHRSCIFEEAAACASAQKDDPTLMFRQVTQYLKEGYPRQHGLTENTVLLRRHNDPAVVELSQSWWQEVLNWSYRDQLSFNYCCWKSDFSYQLLPGTVRNNPYFQMRRHKK